MFKSNNSSNLKRFLTNSCDNYELFGGNRKLDLMPELNIHGYKVSFPFEPYSCQMEYMKRVIEALHNGTNAVLESPTGTGKTLSLLCSVLAFQKIFKNVLFSKKKDPKSRPNNPIYYLARTHSQLKQVVKELEKTEYRPRMTVVGAREHLCIHPEVRGQIDSNQKNQLCKKLVKTMKCKYYSKESIKLPQVFDIEDAYRAGHVCGICPYYHVRSLAENAELILMPYNYLIDPRNRQSNLISLNDSIIIIDEAHNIDSVCEESFSASLHMNDINQSIKLLKIVAQMVTSNIFNTLDGNTKFISKVEPPNSDKILYLQRSLEKFKQNISNQPQKTSETVISMDDIVMLLTTSGFGLDYSESIKEFVDNIMEFLNENNYDNAGSSLLKVGDFLFLTLSQARNNTKEQWCNFKMCVTSSSFSSNSSDRDIDMNFWCFAPSIAIFDLLSNSVRSLIFTSGTLSPINSFIDDLKLKKSTQLQNLHIIDNTCLKMFIIGKYRNNVTLKSTFDSRTDVRYLNSLASLIIELIVHIHGGVLIFFPSYSSLNASIQHWKKSNDWILFTKYKRIFVETKKIEDFNRDSKHFCACSTNGAAYFAVCRGKLSEGFDFPDESARAVFITGLPYPSKTDIRVNTKINVLNQNNPDSGRNWYAQQAMKSVNQAIGRVIRHKNDYGLVFLTDVRFESSAVRNQLCKWSNNFVEICTNFEYLNQQVKNFYRFHNTPSSHSILTAPSLKSTQLPKIIEDNINLSNIYQKTQVTDENIAPSNRLKRPASVSFKPIYNFKLKTYSTTQKSNDSKICIQDGKESLYASDSIDYVKNKFKHELDNQAYLKFVSSLDLYVDKKESIFEFMSNIECIISIQMSKILRKIIFPEHLVNFDAFLSYQKDIPSHESIFNSKDVKVKCSKCPNDSQFKLPCQHYNCDRCMMESAYIGNKCICCKKLYKQEEINQLNSVNI